MKVLPLPLIAYDLVGQGWRRTTLKTGSTRGRERESIQIWKTGRTDYNNGQ